MFKLEKNEFITHFTNLEIKKLYDLLFVLERQINRNTKQNI